jgi:hypothetical protein
MGLQASMGKKREMLKVGESLSYRNQPQRDREYLHNCAVLLPSLSQSFASALGISTCTFQLQDLGRL